MPENAPSTESGAQYNSSVAAPAGSGRLWPGLAGSGRVWPGLAGSGRVWPAQAGSGQPRTAAQATGLRFDSLRRYPCDRKTPPT
eukprot:949913-Prymnesium_polylepis.2